MTTYTVPTDPPDPESAAQDLIVQLPATLLDTSAFTSVLQDLCGLLHAEGALAGLSWHDARQIAAAMAFDYDRAPGPRGQLNRRTLFWLVRPLPKMGSAYDMSKGLAAPFYAGRRYRPI
jgi:hypothetical protein